MRTVLALCCFFAAIFHSLALASEMPVCEYNPTVPEHIRMLLPREGSSIPFTVGKDRLRNADVLGAFYEQRNHEPAWVSGNGLSQKAKHLLQAFRDADFEGLEPKDYHLEILDFLIALQQGFGRHGIASENSTFALIELLISDAYLSYANHNLHGRITLEDSLASSSSVELQELLQHALEEDLDAHLAGLLPPHRGYFELRELLKKYRRISAEGGWGNIPDGVSLRPRAIDPRVPALRARLYREGDLAELPKLKNKRYYDSRTAAALARFQKRHGLVADGIMGKKTTVVLNVSVGERIAQISMNMERWRQVPREFGERYIAINTADFNLSVFEGEDKVMSMPVVVGKAMRRTPILSSRLSHIVFAPYWNVPETILIEDKLPKIRKDPGYLARRNFEVIWFRGSGNSALAPEEVDWHGIDEENFPGVLRQLPGPWNALGEVKFLFPNPFDVYMHDTPEKYLFRRNRRAFSSGCIRVERPLDLAQYVLQGEKRPWDCDAIIKATRRKKPKWVKLTKGLDVHVHYWTIWVDDNGTIQTREDIYLRDQAQQKALASFDSGGAVVKMSNKQAFREGL